MNTRRSNPRRRRTSVWLPLLIVAASGLLGMLLARRFVQPGKPAPVSAQASPAALDSSVAPDTPAAPVPAATDETGVVRAQEQSPAASNQGNVDAAASSARVGTPASVAEDREIGLVLHRWEEALLSNQSQQISAAYANHVERYFLQTNVTRSYVQAYLQGEESRGWRLTAYDVRNVRIQHVSRNEIDVQFVAGFAVTTGNGGRAGSAHTLLKLRPEDGDWKIFFERDLNS